MTRFLSGAVLLMASIAAAPRPTLAQRSSPDSSAVLVGAGDVGNCETRGAAATARLLDSIPGTVFVAGDAAYRSPRDPNPFRTCYDSTWGRLRKRVRPVLGNHDYESTTPSMYFDYFGAAAGPRPNGWYSYEVGAWHVVALNSMLPSTPGSAQDRWLVRDLQQHAGQCGVAVMHYPRFSSGPHKDDHRKVAALWRRLEQHGVSVVIAGHDHLYERFARLDSLGRRDGNGIREFVVGTGGGGHYPFAAVDTGSEVRIEQTYGVLALTLDPHRYAWAFVPTDRGNRTDRGSSPCHPLT